MFGHRESNTCVIHHELLKQIWIKHAPLGLLQLYLEEVSKRKQFPWHDACSRAPSLDWFVPSFAEQNRSVAASEQWVSILWTPHHWGRDWGAGRIGEEKVATASHLPAPQLSQRPPEIPKCLKSATLLRKPQLSLHCLRNRKGWVSLLPHTKAYWHWSVLWLLLEPSFHQIIFSS